MFHVSNDHLSEIARAGGGFCWGRDGGNGLVMSINQQVALCEVISHEWPEHFRCRTTIQENGSV